MGGKLESGLIYRVREALKVLRKRKADEISNL